MVRTVDGAEHRELDWVFIHCLHHDEIQVNVHANFYGNHQHADAYPHLEARVALIRFDVI